jgi:hypothetical protein
MMKIRKLIVTILIACLTITALIAPAQADQGQPSDDKVSTEVAASSEPSVSYHALTEWYSPVIVQNVMCPCYGDQYSPDFLEYGDYITRIDYDGDYVGNNNWDNLGFPTKARPLPAYVYCAVMETVTHYFIWYALFHPADDFHCHDYSHENDLEGMVLCVYKDGSTYGDLRMVQLQAHHDFYQYTPPGETGIDDEDQPDSIDGTIALEGGHHPIVYVEAGGHGIRSEDPDEGLPEVVYRYHGYAEDPDDYGVPSYDCGYDLLSIFAEMWERRTNCCGSGHLFDDWGDYKRYSFSVEGFGRKFDGDDYTGWPFQGPDAASTPWNWDDNDDGDEWLSGDWFMSPALYHGLRFEWDELFSVLGYIFHPFGCDHLGGDIYNGQYGTTSLSHGPYSVQFDIAVLAGQLLGVTSGVTLGFTDDTGIISAGMTEANGSAGAIRLVKYDNPSTGVKLNGELRLQNGGCIRFP